MIPTTDTSRELDQLKCTRPLELLTFDPAELEEAIAAGHREEFTRTRAATVLRMDLERGLDWLLRLWELAIEQVGNSKSRNHREILEIGWELVNRAISALEAHRTEVRQIVSKLSAGNRAERQLSDLSAGVISANVKFLRACLALRIFICGFATSLWPESDLKWLAI